MVFVFLSLTYEFLKEYVLGSTFPLKYKTKDFTGVFGILKEHLRLKTSKVKSF